MNESETTSRTEAVAFYADGHRLHGILYLPADPADTPVPGIVFCHGFGATIEYVAPDIAAALAAHGYAVLIFDHRGFGHSEGPRWRMLPLEQVTDIRSALVYLGARPEVDADRLGLYGISFGGAHAVVAAAAETSVRATVSCVPFSDGAAWMREIRRYWEWVEFLKEVADDRRRTVLTGQSKMVDPDHILVRDPEALEWNGWLKEHWPSRDYKLPLETGRAIVEYRPKDFASNARGLLVLTVTDDTLIPIEQARELYELAGEPRRYVVIDAAHHDIYRGAHFDEVVAEAVRWYRTHL